MKNKPEISEEKKLEKKENFEIQPKNNPEQPEPEKEVPSLPNDIYKETLPPETRLT